MDEEVLLKYDGPALREHRMDVRDLAPALIGLADVVQVAGRVLSPESQIKLDVTATNEGSFEILMILEELEVTTLFAGAGLTALANGVTLSRAIRDTITGAIRILKFAASNGGQPEVVPQELTDGNRTNLALRYPHGLEIDASFPSWQVLQDPAAMAGLAKLAEPLSEGKIDWVGFGDPRDAEIVSVAEKHAFNSGVQSDVLRDDTGPMLLEIVDVSFGNSKWKLSDGDAVFSAAIEDEEFLENVRSRRIRFANGDSLRAEVRTVQRMVNVRPRTDRTILKVYEVYEAPEDPDLFSIS